MDYNTIMNLWMYDFQNILLTFTRIIEQRNKEEENMAKQQGFDPFNFSPDNMMKSVGKAVQMPKLPNFNGGGFKI